MVEVAVVYLILLFFSLKAAAHIVFMHLINTKCLLFIMHQALKKG